jgi:flagellar basal-body rod modification protein FlgD
MAIDAIGGLATSGAATPSNSVVSQDEFLRILLTQLRFQDPLKPVDNEQFVAQLAQFTALEINRQNGQKLDSLLAVAANTQALSLIGKVVEVSGASGFGSGTVTAVSFSTGEPRLTVQTSTTTLVDVKPADVILIR